MFLNIITACSRPYNLVKLSASINIPVGSYRWIVVLDGDVCLNDVPINCEFHTYRHKGSMFGNAQKNFALDLIEHGHIYINDDDTLLHEELWDNICNLNEDFISFNQSNKDGTLRLGGRDIRCGFIDSHNFIISSKILGGTRFLNYYDSDGRFAEECFSKSKSFVYIDKVLSIYNYLKI